MVPDTDDNNSGISECRVISIINTSIAKTIPAIGVLNIALTPAADPQASNKVTSLYSSFNILPKFEPKALPELIIGDSNPTEPPNPAVKIAPVIDENIL